MASTGFADLLDRASSELLRMQEQNRFPSELQVNPDMYETMADIRRRELTDGYPLLVLGLPVEPDATLGASDYRIVR